MWFGKSAAARRAQDRESERSWLGAEALPGGALPAEATVPGEQAASAGVPVLRAGGPGGWLATALRWTRRGRAQ